MVEDCRSVLGADIIALLVQCRRIMQLPEPCEYFLVFNLAGIEHNLNDLCMSCVAITDLLVSWIVDMAPYVARGDRYNSFHLVIDSLNAPEATGSECCQLVAFLDSSNWRSCCQLVV